MKIQYIIGCFLLNLLLFSCEKDVDNSIPSESPTMQKIQQEYRSILESNSLVTNGKVWFSTTPLNFTILYNYLHGEWRDATPFFMGFDFKNKKEMDIYVTVWHSIQTKSKGSELFNNPNIYAINGELTSDLTILGKSVLATLKQKNSIDYDFKILSVNKDSLVLNSYYSKSRNKRVVLKPYDFKKLKVYLKACELLFSENFKLMSVYAQDIKTFNVMKNGASVFKLSASSRLIFPNMLTQNYDKDNDLFLFELELSDRVYDFFVDHKFKYFVPFEIKGKKTLMLNTYDKDMKLLSYQLEIVF